MRIVNQQYRDLLQTAAHPFQSATSIVADGGLGPLDGLVLDLTIMVRTETVSVAWTSLVCTGSSATLVFTDATGAQVAQGLLSSADGAGQIVLTNHGAFAGYMLVSTTFAPIVSGWPAGTYTLDAPILAHLLVISDPAWLAGFQLPDGTVLTGDVYLVADVGVWLSRTADGFSVNVTGNPYATRSAPVGLQTLNGVGPDASGNVNLYNLGAAGSTTGPFRIQIIPQPGRVSIGLVGGDT